MNKQTIDSGPSPAVTLDEVTGDLQVRGWETPQVAVKAEPDDLSLEGQGDPIRLSCTSDLDLHLPHGANLTIGSVHGDASIKFLEEELTAGEVHGDLNLRHIAGCTIDTLHGDLTAKHVTENLKISLIHGDADARHIRGDCFLDDVNGNLDVQDVSGSIRANAKGSARLRLEDVGGTEYRVEADGNLYCYLPETADVRIHMESEGQAIKVRMPQGSTTYQQSDYEVVLGDGGVDMHLTSGGSIYLFVERPGWSENGPGGFGRSENFGVPEDFGQQIAQQVESQIQSQMAEVTRRINEQMNHLSDRLGRAGFSPEETERIVERARRTGEQETERSQEKLRRAQEKLERKLEAHRKRGEGRQQAATDRRTRRQSWGFDWPAPPTPPPAPRPAVSEEERLMILRMLEQKKISLEEADRLLSALEGNE